jgi:lipoyl(octanoyl) transferase
LTPYVEAWEWQKTLVDARLRSLDPKNAEHEVAEAKRRGDPPPIFQDRDCLILVQHPPVVTLGTGSTSDNLKFDPEDVNAPFAVHRTERGGEATYHGPGQLVLYPVFNLREHQTDLHWYMRSLEEVAIRAMRELGVENPGRVEGLTGAWANVPPSGEETERLDADAATLAEKPHKVAAIGVRARRWVTYHGMAFNVCPDLNDFTSIVPCGIGDRPVGSIAQLLARREGIVSTEEGSYGGGGDGGGEVFEDAALMSTSKGALLKAFESVFKVDLNKRGGPPPLRALKAGDKIKCDSCRYLC